MKTSTSDQQLALPAKIAAAGLAGCTADLFTFPLDTIKVWLMVRGESKAGNIPLTNSPVEKSLPKSSFSGNPVLKQARTVLPTKLSKKAGKPAVKPAVRATSTLSVGDYQSSYRALAGSRISLQSRSRKLTSNGALGTIISKIKKNGIRGMYSGLNAGLQRQIGFCSIRVGFYDTVRDYYYKLIPGTPGSAMLGQRILAGGTTGVMAVCLFQFTEVAKIQMQAESERYRGTLQAYRHLFKTGGLKELWKGTGANCTRTAIVNICELVTYDMVKEAILKRNLMNDALPCHFASALISGLITTIVASPVDVVKTRYMNSERGTYRNPIECATRMFRAEGVRAFYKGFVPSYLRLGSWNIVMFVSYEQYKRLFGGINTQHRQSVVFAPVSSPSLTYWEPKYSAYASAIFASIHEAGPIS